ncbi:MAG: antibiotic biosynthesis monooxygenase [Nocardioidaceae bacterium]|nr:antibiotic biosynthesis monooxygenase [Nocardioidaceae bacterium]
MIHTSQEVALYAEFTALPEATEEVRALIGALRDQVETEPGNLQFAVYQLVEDPRRFFVFERYRDRAAFDEHLAADYGTRFNAALTALIVEDGSQLTFLEAP